MQLPKIGGHVSVAGGLSNCVKNAKEIGAETIQIFAGSPRKYDVSQLNKEEFERYKEGIKKENISPVYIHASYLVNLASEEKRILENSTKCIIETLQFASKIDATGVVYHPGSPKGGSKEKALEREIIAIKRILKEAPSDVFLIIENTAGLKKIGTDPNEIGYIFQQVDSKNLRVCVDTAHSLESGNIERFNDEEIEKWLFWWEKEVGLNNLSLLHVNDSLTKSGSYHDRHANIGEGFIGIEGFQRLMRFEKLKKIPWVLEVPGFDNTGPDKKNIDFLKKIRISR
jgi:deoxyribonuclease IV